MRRVALVLPARDHQQLSGPRVGHADVQRMRVLAVVDQLGLHAGVVAGGHPVQRAEVDGRVHGEGRVAAVFGEHLLHEERGGCRQGVGTRVQAEQRRLVHFVST